MSNRAFSRKSPARWLFALHLGIALGYAGFLIRAALDGLLWRADLSAFYTGGAIVRQGLGPHLYDLNLQTRVQQAILGPGRMFCDGVLPCPPAGEKDLGGGLAGTGGGETPGRLLPRAGHLGGAPLEALRCRYQRLPDKG